MSANYFLIERLHTLATVYDMATEYKYRVYLKNGDSYVTFATHERIQQILRDCRGQIRAVVQIDE